MADTKSIFTAPVLPSSADALPDLDGLVKTVIASSSSLEDALSQLDAVLSRYDLPRESPHRVIRGVARGVLAMSARYVDCKPATGAADVR
jgi:hypothetical protein